MINVLNAKSNGLFMPTSLPFAEMGRDAATGSLAEAGTGAKSSYDFGWDQQTV